MVARPIEGFEVGAISSWELRGFAGSHDFARLVVGPVWRVLRVWLGETVCALGLRRAAGSHVMFAGWTALLLCNWPLDSQQEECGNQAKCSSRERSQCINCWRFVGEEVRASVKV